LDDVRTKLTGIGHVELRVRNLDESDAFYRDVFGLVRRPADPPSDKVCSCVGVPASGDETFSIVLTEGLPLGTEIAGLDHVSLTVPHGQDVRDIHAGACRHGVRCTSPRRFNGAYQTFIFDPNGYKIEVVAKDLEDPDESPPARRRTSGRCDRKPGPPNKCYPSTGTPSGGCVNHSPVDGDSAAGRP
jgi:catechol 2,3-dioxygenase-like lactoylglutathione lyase family enzyme